jgi:hypothetical protein
MGIPPDAPGRTPPAAFWRLSTDDTYASPIASRRRRITGFTMKEPSPQRVTMPRQELPADVMRGMRKAEGGPVEPSLSASAVLRLPLERWK